MYLSNSVIVLLLISYVSQKQNDVFNFRSREYLVNNLTFPNKENIPVSEQYQRVHQSQITLPTTVFSSIEFSCQTVIML